MGSKLKRAKTPYLDAGPPGQMFNYHTVWLTFEDFLGEVLDLVMSNNSIDVPASQIRTTW
jgi:hypothetical protein